MYLLFIQCSGTAVPIFEQEVEKYCKMKMYIYHGGHRIDRAEELIKFNIVITSYETLRTAKSSTLYQVEWNRIVLDNADCLRTHISKASKAVFNLSGRKRWAITNTNLDKLNSFPILKFLNSTDEFVNFLTSEQSYTQPFRFS